MILDKPEETPKNYTVRIRGMRDYEAVIYNCKNEKEAIIRARSSLIDLLRENDRMFYAEEILEAVSI